MTDVPGVAEATVEESPVDDQTAPNTGGNDHSEGVLVTCRSALPVLRDRHTDGVVVEANGHSLESLFELASQREVAPANDVGGRDDPLRPDHGPGTTHADAHDCWVTCTRQDAVEQSVQRIPHRVTALVCWGRRAINERRVAVAINQSDCHLGAADVDGEDEVFGR